MTEKEISEFRRESSIVSDIIIKIFELKGYSFQMMYSIMACVMLEIVYFISHQMKRDPEKEIERFLYYLRMIREEMSKNEEKSKAS